MRIPIYLVLSALVVVVSGCSMFGRGSSQSHSSSSLVAFLYPDGATPPPDDTIPELRLPLRVGLAFLPTQQGHAETDLPAATREDLMERIKRRFMDRKFVSEIVTIPDYYLKSARGFDGLQGVQRLYNVDVIALVSYDQVAYVDDNNWSLGYITIVGAYVIKGSRHDITTLVDLAVIDPNSKSLILRAGGTDSRHGNTTLIGLEREARTSSAASFSAATDVTVENFDAALKKFEIDVKENRARVKVVNRNAARTVGGGGGGIGVLVLSSLLVLLAFRAARERWMPKCSLRSVD